MKKMFAFLLLAVFVLSPGYVNAELTTMTAESQQIGIIHQPGISPGDYYKVMFDGEGEASVMAELNKLNTGREYVSLLELEIPGKYVQLKYVFQKVGWDRFEPLEYRSEQLSRSTKYTIELDQAIRPGETGSIILYYKVTGYAAQSVNFYFDFETIKTPTDIQNVRVAVSVDPDLYLRGGHVWTDYRSEFIGFGSIAESVTVGKMTTAQSGALADYSRNIKHATGVVHQKSNLDSWESFHVTGCYNQGNLWFLTYCWELAGVAVFLAVMAFLFWGNFRPRIKFPFRVIKGRFARISLTGLGSAALTITVWWILFSLMDWISRSRWHMGQSGFFVPLLLLALGSGLVVSFLAVPAWAGRKHGLEEAGLVVVSSIVWLFLLLAAIVL